MNIGLHYDNIRTSEAINTLPFIADAEQLGIVCEQHRDELDLKVVNVLELIHEDVLKPCSEFVAYVGMISEK